MNKEFYYLYQYLEREGISIDLNEFELQIQAHSAYPSLLSITDTLSFFNIDNGAFYIDSSQIDSLANRFMAILEDENNENRYYVIEKKNEKYICYKGKNKIILSKKELESRWKGIVILIEKPEIEEETGQKKNKFNPIWFIAKNVLKKTLTELKGVRRFQLKDNTSIGDYPVFKNTLLAFNVLENNLPQSSTIHLGNVKTPLKIIIVINPFSSYCKENYFTMERILEKYFDKVCFEVRFNFNNNDYSNKNSKKIHQHLVAAYNDFGQDGFRKVVSNWFKDNDEKKLYATQISQTNEIKINEILSSQFNSNSENNIIFTPTIVIHKYIFPKQYDLRELSHFINELSEDEDLK